MEWEESVRALVSADRREDALLTIEHALNEGQDAAALLTLLRMTDSFCQPSLAVPLPLARLRLEVRLLGNANQVAEVHALTRKALAHEAQRGETGAAFLHAHLAWALVQREAYLEALAHAETALDCPENLSSRERVLAWRMKGMALNRLDAGSGWEAAFRQALEHAEGWGRALVLIDLGGLYSRQGNEAGAMLAYSEGLLLVSQPTYRAWLLNNMGLICLRSGRFAEAEEYFGQVARMKTGDRSRALSGQGATKRALGEWARAGALYEQAVGAATDPTGTPDEDDLRQALRGLGHTLRLSGQPMKALDTLQQAAQATAGDRASGQSWVNVDVAAALVTLNALDAALVRAYLSRTGPLDREDAERASIVHAELARREGKPAEARAALIPLDGGVLWVREEAHAFPLLFGLLPVDARPEPLPRPVQTWVQLRVLGLPEVQVNGRRVQLSSLEVTVLTALVDAGGELTTDDLIEVLRDHKPRSTRVAAQRVSRTALGLRAALGWETSVRALSRHYLLDPETRWTSDLQTARQQNTPVEAFLSGIGLPWVTTREQELRQLDSDVLSIYEDFS